MEQEEVQDFIGFLRNHYDQGHHLVISEEAICYLSDERLDFLARVIRAAGYEPRIVITSRQYHEWVPSWIQQEFRPAKWNKKYYEIFHDSGGARIPTIPQFLENPLPYHWQCHFDDCHYDWVATDHAPAVIVRNQFQRHFNDIQIFPFNQEGDLATNFICQTLQFADKTCRSLQDGSFEAPPQLNEAIPRVRMDYEYLAQAAYDKYKMVEYSKHRRALVTMIQRHHRLAILNCQRGVNDVSCATNHPFALQCLTESEQQLFARRLVSYERELFPNDFVGTDGGKKYEELLRTKALEKIKDEKYCVIDVEKTLRDPRWSVFFISLGRGEDPYKLPNQPWKKMR
jgi:hypothetical protein